MEYATVVRALVLGERRFFLHDTDSNVALAGQGVCGGEADDATTDDRDVRHGTMSRVSIPLRLHASTVPVAPCSRSRFLAPAPDFLEDPSTNHVMKRLLPFAFMPLFAACGGVIDVDFDVAVLNVDTIQAQDGLLVVCDVVVTATAVGDNGEIGRFGEADFTLRSLASGQTLRTESVSSAFVTSQFNAQFVEAGSSIESRVLQRPAEEGFHWDFVFFYRTRAGARSSVDATARCG